MLCCCVLQLADSSPLKRELVEGVDILIVRELVGGIYFGQPRVSDTPGVAQQQHGRDSSHWLQAGGMMQAVGAVQPQGGIHSSTLCESAVCVYGVACQQRSMACEKACVVC